MADDAVVKFAEALAREVDDARDDPTIGVSSTEALFTRLVLQHLEEAGHLEGAYELSQEGKVGRSPFRISGYALDEEADTLDLFATAYDGDLPPKRIPLADLVKVAKQAMTYVAACLDGLADRIEPSHTEAGDLARRVAAVGGGLRRFRVIVLTDGLAAAPLATAVEWKGRSVELDLYDMVRLQRVLGAGETRSDIEVDFVDMLGRGLPCLPVSEGAAEYEAFLAAIPGDVLSRIYDRYGTRLLELNVRAFLGVAGRKTVNAELRRTLVENPSMFLAFNNGVVATADEVAVEASKEGHLLTRLKGLQIVNGGQTTASLHRARYKEGTSLAAVEVPIKILKVSQGNLDEMVSSVSRAANRQNTVQQADFSANDPFHQAVETLAANTWLENGRERWFYERARGAYLAAEQKAALKASEKKLFQKQTPKSRLLKKVDLARYLNAWEGQPWRVAFGDQKNFNMFMQSRKERPSPSPDEAWFKRLVALAILYRTVAKIVKAKRVPAYGANIVAYTVAAVGERTGGRMDFDLIWKEQDLSPAFETLLIGWTTQVEAQLRSSAGSRNPTEWFKKADCWVDMRGNLPALKDPLPPEMASVGRPAVVNGQGAKFLSDLSAVDYERIERCMTIPAAMWISAAEKGQRTGVIHYRQAGVCMTLAGYASGGWAKRPSVKQAKAGLDAIAALQLAGHLRAVAVQAGSHAS